jgi:hypothetical protein
VLPIVSNYKFASKERGYKPNNVKVAGAAACGTHRVAASAGGTPATGTRHLAKDLFVLALSGNKNTVAASADLPESYARHHEMSRLWEQLLEHAT